MRRAADERLSPVRPSGRHYREVVRRVRRIPYREIKKQKAKGKRQKFLPSPSTHTRSKTKKKYLG
jgi:hypothetical protein